MADAIITADIIKNTLPKCKDPVTWAKALSAAAQKYHINSKLRIASFLAQTGHESGQFNKLSEDLYYSKASRLVAVWPKRFPNEAFAAQYIQNPEKLANYVYANRIGNGAEASGDGYRFRGRGIMQITGRSNYAAASKELGVDLIKNPDLLLQAPYAALSAAWYWASHGLNELADDNTGDDDTEDFRTITKKINGGLEGFSARLALLNAIESQMG